MRPHSACARRLLRRPSRPRNGGQRAHANVIDCGTLFESDTEVLIRHDDTLYSLRKTGQDKLILTK